MRPPEQIPRQQDQNHHNGPQKGEYDLGPHLQLRIGIRGEGVFYWRVAAVARDGSTGPHSSARRFRVTDQQIRDRDDHEPPQLDVTEFVPIGQMVVVNGQTEPGATVWIDDDRVDVYDDGTFNAVVRLRRDGHNEIVVVAQDNAGNESTERRTAYLEYY